MAGHDPHISERSVLAGSCKLRRLVTITVTLPILLNRNVEDDSWNHAKPCVKRKHAAWFFRGFDLKINQRALARSHACAHPFPFIFLFLSLLLATRVSACLMDLAIVLRRSHTIRRKWFGLDPPSAHCFFCNSLFGCCVPPSRGSISFICLASLTCISS